MLLTAYRTRFLLSVLFAFLSWQQSLTQWGSVSEQYLLAAANRDRLEHNLPPVRLDASLTSAALLHAQSMVQHRTISHQFSGEADLAARAADAGARFSLVTENVAEASNSALIHELWMKSAGHRANLLDRRVDSVGIAVLALGGQLYAVEDFAHNVQKLTFLEQEGQVSRLVQDSGIEILGDAVDARQTCSMESGFAGARQPWFVMRYTATDLTQLPEQLTARLSSGKYHHAAVGACETPRTNSFSSYSFAVMLFP